MRNDGTRRTKQEVASRVEEWTKLFLKGKSPWEIEKLTGFSHSSIGYALKKAGVYHPKPQTSIRPIKKKEGITGKQYKNYKQYVIPRDMKGNKIGEPEVRKIAIAKNPWGGTIKEDML